MSIAAICDILGNGNEYFTGTEILDQLRAAGYVVMPKEPTDKMVEAAFGKHGNPNPFRTAWIAMVNAYQ